MKEVTVTLGNKDYTLKQLPIRANREWRARFNGPVNTLLSAFTEVGKVSTVEFKDGKELMQKIGGILLARASDVAGILLESMDFVLDGLFAYSDELRKDQAYIEENATDDEAMKAFVEVLKLAYPFGRLMNLAGQIGQTDKETSPSSPEPSGE